METITRQINIAVVDDHWAILEGYQSLLKKLNYVNSVHVFTTSKDFFEETKHTDFDLVLLDIELKEESGLDICKIIKEGNSKIKVIIESLHESKGFILHAYENNADGYIFKGGDYDELKNAINKIVFHNEKYFTPIASKIIFDKHESAKMHNSNSKTGLTEREIEIIKLICVGKTDKRIARILNISESTVATHRQNIMRKINCHKSTEIITYAIKNGLYSLNY